MILIDEPRWPAHGTHFAHLVSDASADELLNFARTAGLHPRAFDHDHYDVPAARYDELVALGAVRVDATDLVRRLRASGLRVAQRDRTPKRRVVLPRLRAGWAALLPDRPALGADLLARWTGEGRHYHDVRHLAQTLESLDLLGHTARPTLLAAWFHDAVYEGAPGDEEASAALASELLDGVVPDAEAAEVARLVRLTAFHRAERDDASGNALVGADLSILGQVRGRYLVYARDVRLDYAHVSDDDFRVGRLRVLDSLLAREPLFGSPTARRLWEARARENAQTERNMLNSGRNFFQLSLQVRS